MRYVASLFIVIYHFNGEFFGDRPEILKVNHLLAAGVDLFFIISGFLMAMIVFSAQHSFGSYWKSRLLKIVPLYFVLTVFLYFADQHLDVFPNRILGLQELLSSLTFSSLVLGLEGPILAVGWTLEYEMFFYFLVSIAVVLKTSPIVKVYFLSLTLLFLAQFSGFPLLAEFIFGLLTYVVLHCWDNGTLHRNKFAFFLIALCLAYLLGQGFERPLYFGVPMLAVFLWSFRLNRTLEAPSFYNHSYEIYLFHLIIVKVYFSFIHASIGSYALGIAFCLVSVGVACLCWMKVQSLVGLVK